MRKTETPTWYWTHGLHDAGIVSATKKESYGNPTDNCLILKIDCESSLGEADVLEIRFYNFKILSANFDITPMSGGWWLSDELTQKDNRYVLELHFDTKQCKTKNLKIEFDKAEVVRNIQVMTKEKHSK